MTTSTPKQNDDWPVAIPATSAVHLPPNPKADTKPLTNQQLKKLAQQLIESIIRQVVLALTGMLFPQDSALAQLMKWAQDLRAWLESMDSLADWRALGQNLVPSPHFDVPNLKRFPIAEAQTCGYATGEEHHSGLKSWKWFHFPATDSGLYLAPSPSTTVLEVAEGSDWFVEAWVYPKATNSITTGSIRIGGTFKNSAGSVTPADLYMDCPLNGPDMVRGQWNKINTTVTVPAGCDQAEFWVRSTADTEAGSVFWIDDVIVRQNASEALALVQADIANFIVSQRAKAGSCLVISPTFSNASVTRFPYNTNQLYSYAHGPNEKKHSGFQSWKWTQETNAACGLYLAPTTNVDSFDVTGAQSYFVEAWVYPASTNAVTGSVRIGGTFTDSGAVLSPSDVYYDCPLNGPDMVRGQWNKINISIDVPNGYDTAKFWVIATSAVTAGSVFWIDDVNVREHYDSKQALAQANYANFVTNLKSKTGQNMVVDPSFSMGALVDRYPYNTNALYGYSATYHFSGLQSWKWTQETSAGCGLILAPTAKVSTYQVNDTESYNVSGWVYAPTSNPGTTGAMRIGATFSDSSGALPDMDEFVETPLSTIGKGVWKKLSATIDVLENYDTAQFWIIATAATPGGYVFHVDDVSVRDAAALNAGNKAALAQQNIQDLVDNIHQAIQGGLSSNHPITSVLTNLRDAWSKFFDGLHGSTGSTGKLPSDVQVAAAAVKSTADTAAANATTGIAKADTAQSAADAAQDTADTATSIATTISKNYNLVDNPGFESTDLPLCGMGFSDLSPTTLMFATNVGHGGRQSAKTVGYERVYFNQKPHPVGYWYGAPIDVQPGNQFYTECYVYNPSGNAYAEGGYTAIMAEYWAADGTSNAQMVSVLDEDVFGCFKGPGFLDLNDTLKLPVGQWTKLWGYFTVPAGAYKMAVAIHVYPLTTPDGPVAQNVYYWDDPLLVRAEVQAEVDQAIIANAAGATADVNAVTARALAATAQTATDQAAAAITIAARDYTNIAAGSDFESWGPERSTPSGGVTADCYHPWNLGTSRWTVNGSHIYWGPGGYIENPGEPPPGRTWEDFNVGHCLMAGADTVVTYATLKTFPVAQSGEQFYIEFMAMRDSYYNGTDSLSRLRVGYNDEDVFVDAVPFGAGQFTAPLQWQKFSKTVTVPEGAQYVRFSLGANHNTTNQSQVSVAGRDGNNHWLEPGQGGRIYLDNIIIRRVVPPDGIELLPQDKITNLPTNLEAVAAYRGANIIPNGDFENSSYSFRDNNSGALFPGVNAVYSTADQHSGTQSARLDAGTLGWARVIMPLNPITNDVDYIRCAADGSDVFLVECWVKGDTTNTYVSAPGLMGGWAGGFGIMLWPKDLEVKNPAYWFQSFVGCVGLTETVRTACHGTWTRVQAVFSPPAGITGFSLAAEGQGMANKWFVDDFTCYRITEGAVAKTAADGAAANASTANANAATADGKAVAAQSNIQSVVDGTVQAVDGGTATGASAATHKTKLQLAWAKLWDGLHGTTNTTSKLPADLYTAAAAVKQSAENGVANAATADGKATTAQSGVQSVVDGVSEAVYGDGVGVGGAPTTVKARVQKVLGALFDAFNGTTGTNAKTVNEVYVVGAAVTTQANAGVANAATAQGSVNMTNTALFGQSTAGSTIITGAVPNLNASKITSGNLSKDVLPTKLAEVGSGFVMRKSSGSINVSCSANSPTPIKFPTSAYSSTASNTGDYTLSTGGGGELKVSAANAGWYMVEVAFGLEQQARIIGYRMAAALFLNGSITKVGSTVDYYGSSSTQYPFSCQASFIVYLNTGDYVTPGAMLYSQSTISGLSLITTNSSVDFYFSVSLLNRSLA